MTTPQSPPVRRSQRGHPSTKALDAQSKMTTSPTDSVATSPPATITIRGSGVAKKYVNQFYTISGAPRPLSIATPPPPPVANNNAEASSSSATPATAPAKRGRGRPKKIRSSPPAAVEPTPAPVNDDVEMASPDGTIPASQPPPKPDAKAFDAPQKFGTMGSLYLEGGYGGKFDVFVPVETDDVVTELYDPEVQKVAYGTTVLFERAEESVPTEGRQFFRDFNTLSGIGPKLLNVNAQQLATQVYGPSANIGEDLPSCPSHWWLTQLERIQYQMGSDKPIQQMRMFNGIEPTEFRAKMMKVDHEDLVLPFSPGWKDLHLFDKYKLFFVTAMFPNKTLLCGVQFDAPNLFRPFPLYVMAKDLFCFLGFSDNSYRAMLAPDGTYGSILPPHSVIQGVGKDTDSDRNRRTTFISLEAMRIIMLRIMLRGNTNFFPRYHNTFVAMLHLVGDYMSLMSPSVQSVFKPLKLMMVSMSAPTVHDNRKDVKGFFLCTHQSKTTNLVRFAVNKTIPNLHRYMNLFSSIQSVFSHHFDITEANSIDYLKVVTNMVDFCKKFWNFHPFSPSLMTTLLARSTSLPGSSGMSRPFQKRSFAEMLGDDDDGLRLESSGMISEQGSPKKQKISDPDYLSSDDAEDDLDILIMANEDIDSDIDNPPESPCLGEPQSPSSSDDDDGETFTTLDDDNDDDTSSDWSCSEDSEDLQNDYYDDSYTDEKNNEAAYWVLHPEKDVWVGCDKDVPSDDEKNTEHYPQDPKVPTDYLRKAAYLYSCDPPRSELSTHINLTQPKSLLYLNQQKKMLKDKKVTEETCYIPSSIPVDPLLEPTCDFHGEQFFDARELTDNVTWGSDKTIHPGVFSRFVDSDPLVTDGNMRAEKFSQTKTGLPLETLLRSQLDGTNQPTLEELMTLKRALDNQVDFLTSFSPINQKDIYDGQAEEYLKKCRVRSGVLIRNPTLAGITSVCQTLFGIKCAKEQQNLEILKHIQPLHEECFKRMPNEIKVIRAHTQTAFDNILGGHRDLSSKNLNAQGGWLGRREGTFVYCGAVINEMLNFVANTIPAEICCIWSDLTNSLRELVDNVAHRWQYIKNRKTITPEDAFRIETWVTDAELFTVNPEELDVGYSVIVPIINISEEDKDFLREGHDFFRVSMDAELNTSEELEKCLKRLRMLSVDDFEEFFCNVKATLERMMATCNRGLDAVFKMAAVNFNLMNDAMFMMLTAYGRIIQLLDTWSYRFNPSRMRQLAEKDFRWTIKVDDLLALNDTINDDHGLKLPLTINNERTISCLKFATSTDCHLNFSNYTLKRRSGTGSGSGSDRSNVMSDDDVIVIED